MCRTKTVPRFGRPPTRHSFGSATVDTTRLSQVIWR